MYDEINVARAIILSSPYVIVGYSSVFEKKRAGGSAVRNAEVLMSAMKILGRATPRAMKERAYLFDTGGLYISQSLTREIRRPRSAALYLAIPRNECFALRVGTKSEAFEAVAVQPLVRRRVHAPDVAMAGIVIAPTHPAFAGFSVMPGAGLLALPRCDFARYDRALYAVLRGQLSTKKACELFDGIVTTAAATLRLPPAKSRDPHICKVLALLQLNPDCTLKELATAARRSYHRMSHTFTQNVGLSLRSYQSWQKIDSALRLLLRGYSATAAARIAGFTDASHLYRACHEEYGVGPAFFQHKFARARPPVVTRRRVLEPGRFLSVKWMDSRDVR